MHVHFHFNFGAFLSRPRKLKQQREMTKFKVLWET